MERLEALHRQLDGSMSVLALMEQGEIVKTKDGEVTCPGVKAWTVYKDDKIQVIMSNYDPLTTWPKHEHTESIEYIICASGTFEVTITYLSGEIKFYQATGSCIKLPPNVIHSVYTIKGGSLLAVCVPPEKGY